MFLCFFFQTTKTETEIMRSKPTSSRMWDPVFRMLMCLVSAGFRADPKELQLEAGQLTHTQAELLA